MSKPLLVFGLLLSTALFVAGCAALLNGHEALFFKCTIGSLFIAAFLYFGAFMQGLRVPKQDETRFGTRSTRQELEALADANPQVPGLKRLYAWVIGAAAAVVVLRLLQGVLS